MHAAIERHSEIDQLLRHGAEYLDISPELHREATSKHGEVCDWLGEPRSQLAEFSPDLFPQGSFRLGTAVRPILHEDEYDIDLVCLLRIERDSVTKAQLKALIGDRLKEHHGYRRILTEGKRCWTLNFPGKFHMDILPAIPDPDRRDGFLLITDKGMFRWQSTAPRPFAEWFFHRMRPALLEAKRAYARETHSSVEEVPDWHVKTPLQRAIQILKRHRDFYFRNDEENCPASIIITTLAARAYRNQPDLTSALDAILSGMPGHIEQDDGEFVILNPVNGEENFADRWKGKPDRPLRFFAWLSAVRKDLTDLASITGLPDISRRLEPALGRRLAESAVAAFGRSLRTQRETGQLRIAALTGTLVASGTAVVPPHTFYGA